MPAASDRGPGGSDPAARSHGVAPGAGLGVRVSQGLSSPVFSSPVPEARSDRPGVALSPSLMSYRPSRIVGACAPLRTVVVCALNKLEKACPFLLAAVHRAAPPEPGQVVSHRTETTCEPASARA